MNTNPSPLRTGLRGAAIGVTAVAASVFGLAAAAGASDSVDTVPVEAETSVYVPADAEIIELTEGDLVEFDLGDVDLEDLDGEWFVAEMVDADDIPADAEIIDVSELADAEEYRLLSSEWGAAGSDGCGWSRVAVPVAASGVEQNA